jgi:hypothetical protein
VQALKQNDKCRWYDCDFEEKLEEAGVAVWPHFMAVNHPSVHVWGSKNPHQVIKHEGNSPKVNVFCAISHHNIYGPFFLAKKSVNGNIYLDRLINWLMSQLHEDSADFDSVVQHPSVYSSDTLCLFIATFTHAF